MSAESEVGLEMIAQGKLDALFFFPDPLEAQHHDVDIKGLLRLVLVYDIPAAFSPTARRPWHIRAGQICESLIAVAAS